MKIICSGMSKTGTKSLAAALRILGYKVYDFEEQYFYLGKELCKILDEGWTINDLQRLFKNVDAITDIPANVIWEDLLEAFPDSKVVHTERLSEKIWYSSLETQVTSIKNNLLTRILTNLSPTGRKFRKFSLDAMSFGTTTVNKGIFNPFALNKRIAIMKYRQHNTRVKTVVPKKQLLLFKLTDGWKPLCQFLNKPVPEENFPHKNKNAGIRQEFVYKSYVLDPIKQEVKLLLAGVVFLVLICLYSILF